jgi:ABC-type transport system substrate-binding protein
MNLRFLAPALAALVLVFAAGDVPAQAAPQKVLRVAFKVAETSFDPATTSDLYSNNIIEEIFESPLTYDFLARPAKLKVETLEAMPEITDGGRTYTLKIRKGLHFSDDPAFEGRKRELTASDYEFAFKRLMDPKLRSPNLWLIEGRLKGMEEAIERAKKDGRFDYDAKVPGIEVLDRYTLRFHLAKPDYNFLYILAMPNIGAQAREVVERYGADIGAHPVGTGAFRLVEWKRSAKIVLERNPNFREMYFEAEPPAGDALAQQKYAELKGKRLPIVDRVEVSIIEESQPRWLAFLNNELDWIELPYEFNSMAMPAGKLSAPLAKRGIRQFSDVETVITYLYFNMRTRSSAAIRPRRWRCAAPSRSRTTTRRRSASCATAWRSRRRPRCRPASSATTRTSTSARPTTRRRPRRCSTCSATWTATATAGATCRTAARSCSTTRRSPTSSRGSSRSCGRSTWTRSACA